MAKKIPMSYEAGLLRALSPAGFPVLTKALLSLTPVESDDVPVAAVDEWWRLYYNPKFFANLSVNAATGVILHEVWHLLRFHFVRARHYGVRKEERFLWNLAADVEIHDDYARLLALLGEMPAGCEPLQRTSFDPPLKPFGTAETWFDELKARAVHVQITFHLGAGEGVPGDGDISLGVPGDGNAEGDDTEGGAGASETVLLPELINDRKPTAAVVRNTRNGSGVSGHAEPWEKMSPAQGGPQGLSPERAAMVRDVIAQAIKHASTTIGSGTGGVVRWANEIVNPQVDWRTKLRDTFQGAVAKVLGNSDYSYRKMCRRHNHDPRIIKPGSVGLIPRVGVIVDTSGSMSDTHLSVCRQEITSLLDSIGRSVHVHVYACDAQAHQAQKVRDGAAVKLYGGGGTDMTAAFKLIEEDVRRLLTFDLLILMTDGYTPWPTEAQLPCRTVLVLVGSRNNVFPSYPSFFDSAAHDAVKAYVD